MPTRDSSGAIQEPGVVALTAAESRTTLGGGCEGKLRPPADPGWVVGLFPPVPPIILPR